jgi:hypothetical protein
MLLRTPTGFIEPCLPSSGEHPPTASEWVHEIKHDGYRLIARRGPIGIRLLTRNGIVGAMNRLKVRSCLIDAGLWPSMTTAAVYSMMVLG